ncbi:hypothetical protein QFC24_004254 [Naganishia onofrii]|uniref:Uncharacterized protein n=1 Tax=Naganishia onofrii TaxID=1851511 RepID=A0ACC2XH31_9TREE|nr:hypothetical protein QFC24_004254 [Naganishia onofrii]
MSENTALPTKCYIITGTELDHHTDRKGRMKLPTKQAYSTLKEANAAAFTHLISRYDSTPDPGSQPEYQHAESETELFVGSFTPLTRNVFEYVVRVKEFKMNYPKVPKQRGGKKAAAAVPTAGDAGQQGTQTAARGVAGTAAPIPSLAAHPTSIARQHIATGTSGPSSSLSQHTLSAQAVRRAALQTRPVDAPAQSIAPQHAHSSTSNTASKRAHTMSDDDVVVIQDDDEPVQQPERKKRKRLEVEVESDGRPVLDELSADDIASMFTTR